MEFLLLYLIIASWIWFQFGALCSTAAGALLAGLSVSSLHHTCGEEMAFKQRQRVNGSVFLQTSLQDLGFCFHICLKPVV